MSTSGDHLFHAHLRVGGSSALLLNAMHTDHSQTSQEGMSQMKVCSEGGPFTHTYIYTYINLHLGPAGSQAPDLGQAVATEDQARPGPRSRGADGASVCAAARVRPTRGNPS